MLAYLNVFGINIFTSLAVFVRFLREAVFDYKLIFFPFFLITTQKNRRPEGRPFYTVHHTPILGSPTGTNVVHPVGRAEAGVALSI